MEQPQIQQPKVIETAKPVEEATPPEGVQAQPIEGKNKKWLLWLIIAVVIIGLGFGAYFWLIK